MCTPPLEKVGIRAGHIERRGVVGADGHRRRALRAFDPGIAGQRRHAIEAHHAGQADGRVVVRSHESEAGSHLAVKLAFIVARRVLVLRSLAVGGLRVVQHGDRRKEFGLPRQHRAFDGGLKGRRIDERLEDGARGTVRDRVVHLRRAIAAPAHQRQHLAGVGIERNQRHLRIDVRLAQLPVARMQLVHLRVHDVNGGVDGLRCQALQIGIERGVDAQAFAVEIAVAEPLRELVVHQIDKVGRFAFVHAGRDQMQRLSLGGLGLILGDGAGLDHRVQHQVAPLDGALGMTEGIQAAGALDEPGEQSALGQVELAHILAEVGLRRLAEAVDGKAAAAAREGSRWRTWRRSAAW